MQERRETEQGENGEIDLFLLVRNLWSAKTFVIKVTILCAILGFLFAWSLPKTYSASVIFTSDSNQTSGGSMGALASLAGVNLNQGSAEGIQPTLYPDILDSYLFIQELFDIPIVDKKNDINTTLYDFLKNYQVKPWYSYVIGFPRTIINSFSSSSADEKNNDKTELNSRYISKEEMGVINSIKNSYNIDVDKKTNLITFSINNQNPNVVAFLADTITAKLQQFVIEWKLKKAQNDLENSQKLFKDATSSYEDALQKMAEFTDKNKNVVSAQYAIKQKDLQNQLNLAYSMYTQMAQQVQLDKVKIQDQKPVFAILQPAFDPLIPVSPNKKLFFIAFAFLGFVGSSLWVLRKDFMDIFNA